ncbi:3-keto-5-aminohexanoate cleavage protein, partial [Mesorhizobium sp. M1E.F.Ca.ET.041.01.1.1]
CCNGAAAYNEKMMAVPITPEQIADECISAVNAGAAICHIHVRDPRTGAPSMSLVACREEVERIRASATDVINVTTGAGARYIPDQEEPLRPAAGSTLSTPEVRARHVVALQPEISSLDIDTMNFGTHAVINTPDHTASLAHTAQQVGTTCEIEVFDVGHAARKTLEDRLIKRPPFFPICLGVSGGVPVAPEVLLPMRHHLPRDANWGALVFPEPNFPWSPIARWLCSGWSRRQSLERAVAIVQILGGETASPAEARQIPGPKSQSILKGQKNVVSM